MRRWASTLLGVSTATVLAGPAMAAELDGASLFTRKGCIACHVLKGHPDATGTMGPNLSKLNRAKPPRDPAEIAAVIRDPQAVKPGSPMPRIGLSSEEAQAIARYLLSARTPAPKASSPPSGVSPPANIR